MIAFCIFCGMMTSNYNKELIVMDGRIKGQDVQNDCKQTDSSKRDIPDWMLAYTEDMEREDDFFAGLSEGMEIY